MLFDFSLPQFWTNLLIKYPVSLRMFVLCLRQAMLTLVTVMSKLNTCSCLYIYDYSHLIYTVFIRLIK